MFHLADIRGLEFHPDALKRVTRSLRMINAELRENEEANRLFLSILTSKRQPAIILRRMNEAGVLGRFIPEFGKIVAMMQFNMYHHYTVDEHLIRTVSVLSGIDKGEEGREHPLASKIMPGIEEREALYVAVFLHDIAKGRPEDHSIAGARAARKLCPRAGPVAQADRACGLAGRGSFDHVDGGADARSQRPQDHHRFRREGPHARAAEDAAGALGLRYPRRRSWRLERLEGSAPAHALL